jgi:hypothetical protein
MCEKCWISVFKLSGVINLCDVDLTPPIIFNGASASIDARTHYSSHDMENMLWSWIWCYDHDIHNLTLDRWFR